MNAVKSSHFASVTVAFGGILLSTDAFAYIDPGTGTLLIQWLFGMAVASLAALRIHWYRAKTFISGKFRNDAVRENTEGETDDSGSD